MDFDREDGFSFGSPCSPPATVSSGYFGLGSSTPILLPPPPRLFCAPQYPTPYSLPPSPRPIFPQTPQYTPLRSLPPPPEAPPLFRTSSPSSLQPQSKWPINSGSLLNPLKVPPGISVHDSVSPSIKWSDETLIEHNVSISNRSSKNSLLLPLAWPGRLSMMPPPPGRVQSPSPEPLPSQPQAVLQSSNLNAYLNDTSSEVFGRSRSSSSNVLPGSATTSGEDGSEYFPSISRERVPIDPDSPLPPVAAFIGGRRGPEDQYVDISLLNRPPLASDNEALAGLSWSQAAFDSSHFSDPGCPSPVMSQVSSARSHDSGYISDLSGACGIKTRKRCKSHRRPVSNHPFNEKSANRKSPASHFDAENAPQKKPIVDNQVFPSLPHVFTTHWDTESYSTCPQTSAPGINTHALSSPSVVQESPNYWSFIPPETALVAARCCSCTIRLQRDGGTTSQIPCRHVVYSSCRPAVFQGGDLCFRCRREAARENQGTRRPLSTFLLGLSNETSISHEVPNPLSSGRILSSPPLSWPIPEIEELKASYPSTADVQVDTGPTLGEASNYIHQTGPSSSEHTSRYDLVPRSFDSLDLYDSPRPVAMLNQRKPLTGYDLFDTREPIFLAPMKTSFISQTEFMVVLDTIADMIVLIGPKSKAEGEFQELGNELENLNECLKEIFNLYIPSRHEISANEVKTMSLTCYPLLKAFYEKLLIARTPLVYEYGSETIMRSIYDAEVKKEARKLQAYIAAHVGSLNMRLLSLAIHSNYQSRTKISQPASNGQMPRSRFEKMADLIGSPQGSDAFTNQGDSPGNSTRSDDSGSADDDEYLMVLLAKHKILASLMREVYSILGYNPTETPGQSPSDAGEINAGPSSYQVDAEHGRSQNKGGKGKKRVLDRDSQPPDEDEDDGRKKRSRGEPDSLVDGDGRLYACPFFKYDPRKYNCNSSTGKKYRTCAGPGWNKIARLKQHLERTHCAPIQCRRCWQDFLNEAALTDHSRSAQQCPILPQGPVESIPLHKWDIIKSRWGATWNFIFGILFPSVTIPSCYYDDIPSTQILPPSPPASQDFAGYEAYSRKELPRLIEGILDGMINADREPLDEKFKPLVLEVVRNCHSTLAHRWDMIKEGSSSKPLASLPSASNPPSSVGQPLPFLHSISRSNTNIESTAVPSIYQVPPALCGDVADATFQAFEESQNTLPGLNRPAQSDSGYESQQPADRFCTCGPALDLGYPGSQDSNFFADSFVDPGNLSSSVQDHIRAEGHWSVENSGGTGTGIGTVSISQERTVVRCSFCGGWRDK